MNTSAFRAFFLKHRLNGYLILLLVLCFEVTIGFHHHHHHHHHVEAKAH